ncbi:MULTISPECIES: nuclear transport factor 2 family protein [unclassified Mycobacterium]|uniref:nuclear transport factor 2 family protein n=1 Tax=unclassified Mycobacterium TaxID=2642494 RepID=UPI00274213E2|nr:MULTISPECIES: nuclear transport factor 2 family protein [unclassified Mycobacterium]MDP7703676.1 nuclear transport factor 2 family protein [Mycobacterium sp. TY815]MDP7722156.1 nuclear transport factor 2 family protein [Mycobacterium sp. TY814]
MTHPFRAAVEAGQFATIGSIFAEDGVLHSPIAHRPYRGRAVIATVVGTVATVLDDFHFVRELDGALIFQATVDGLEIQGCDILHTDDDGLVDEITVMMRPLKAVAAFAARMRAELSDGA